MPLLDDRGRLFGKVNLIDGAVALLVLLLIPLGYGAYYLFRTEEPTITAMTPRSVRPVENEVLQLTGTNLRPFLRAFVGQQMVTYMFISPDSAEVKLTKFPPGSYELVLFDEAREVAKAGTFTVEAPSKDVGASVMVLGAFNRLTESQAALLKPGVRLLPAGAAADPAATEFLEIVGTRPAQPATVPFAENNPTPVRLGGLLQVAVVLKLQGHLSGQTLMFRDRAVTVNTELELADPDNSPSAPGGPPKLPLRMLVQRAYTEATTPVDVRARFIVRPDVVELVRRDAEEQAKARDPFRALGPQVISLTVKDDLTGQTKQDLREGRVNIIEAVIRVPATRNIDGWTYENRPLRPGADTTIDTPVWQLTGNVLTVTPRDADAR